MSRTRFPVWRAIGLGLALNNAIWLLIAFQVFLHPDTTAIESVGWFSRASVPSDESYLTLAFCLGVSVAGALASLKWPWQGFVLLGAGYLFSAISLLVLFRWTRDHLVHASVYAAPGLWFSRLGWKDRTRTP